MLDMIYAGANPLRVIFKCLAVLASDSSTELSLKPT